MLAIAVKGALPKQSAPGFEAERYWQAAFFRAGLARVLAERLHPSEQARSFTGGLLQDMAIPLLAHARPDDYGRVLEEWHGTPNSKLFELEKSALGWTHDEVGGHLGVEWELPDSLTTVIQGHHDDSRADSDLPPALRLVSLHRETECEHGIDAVVDVAGSMYGLDSDWTKAAVESSREQALELAKAFR